MPKRHWLLQSASLLASLVLSGCSSIGPPTIARDRFDYATAISESWQRQTLLNIVKIRYMDVPAFLDVANITSGYTLSGSVNLGDLQVPGQGGEIFVLGGSGKYSHGPAITYAPIRGKEFTKSFMTPIPPSVLLFLMQGGWPVDLIVPIAVKSMNGLNSYVAAGAEQRAGDPEFYQVIKILRKIQLSGRAGFGLRILQPGEKLKPEKKMTSKPTQGEQGLGESKNQEVAPEVESEQTKNVTEVDEKQVKELAAEIEKAKQAAAEDDKQVKGPAADVEKAKKAAKAEDKQVKGPAQDVEKAKKVVEEDKNGVKGMTDGGKPENKGGEEAGFKDKQGGEQKKAVKTPGQKLVETTYLRLQREILSPKLEQAAKELDKHLGLRPGIRDIKVTFGRHADSDDEIAMLTRSMLDILFQLAYQADVPAEHVADGYTIASFPTSPFLGTELGQLIKIHHGTQKPDNAFVAVD